MRIRLNQAYSDVEVHSLVFIPILDCIRDRSILLHYLPVFQHNRIGCIYITGYILAGCNDEKMKTLNIYLNLDETIKDFMLRETKSRVSNRYKLIHIAEDMDVHNTQLWRFMKGEKVAEDFYIKWFNWYSKNQ